MFKQLKEQRDWSDKNVAERGFTLIELLVVIAILGILAVVGILSFNGLTDNAHHAVNQTEKTQVQTAVDAYRAQNEGAIPPDTAALVPDELAQAPVCAWDINQSTGVVTLDATQPNPSCTK